MVPSETEYRPYLASLSTRRHGPFRRNERHRTARPCQGHGTRPERPGEDDSRPPGQQDTSRIARQTPGPRCLTRDQRKDPRKTDETVVTERLDHQAADQHKHATQPIDPPRTRPEPSHPGPPDTRNRTFGRKPGHPTSGTQSRKFGHSGRYFLSPSDRNRVPRKFLNGV